MTPTESKDVSSRLLNGREPPSLLHLHNATFVSKLISTFKDALAKARSSRTPFPVSPGITLAVPLMSLSKEPTLTQTMNILGQLLGTLGRDVGLSGEDHLVITLTLKTPPHPGGLT